MMQWLILSLAFLFASSANADSRDGPAMVRIPPGIVATGSAEGNEDERPPRRFETTRAFEIGVTEVTRGAFAAFIAETGYRPALGCNRYVDGRLTFAAEADWRNPGFPQTDDHPVVCVSWTDAQAYIAWLNARTGKRFRLPSEGEWLLAAGAVDRAEPLCTAANGLDLAAMDGNLAGELKVGNADIYPSRAMMVLPCNDGGAFTLPVARLAANEHGLVDMLGNVWEWMEDCHSQSLAPLPGDGTPHRAFGCEAHTIRGGGWNTGLAFLRRDNRSQMKTETKNWSIGFRLARDGE
jgi:formylglycine-generating enzyme required for sulfatase activity